MKKFISKLLSFFLLIGLYSFPVSANSKSTIDSSVINNVDPYEFQKIPLNKSLGKINIDSNKKYLSIPNNSDEYVKLKTNSNKFLGMKIVADSDSNSTVDNNTVFYEDVSGEFTSAIEALEGATRQLLILNSEEAPEEYSISFDIPENGYLEFAKDISTNKTDGSVLVYDGNDTIIAAIDIPWAKDSNGNNVNTHYKISGNELIQIVEHKNQNLSYPIIADPMVFSDYFSSGSWINRDGLISLSLVPNLYLRGIMASAYSGGYIVSNSIKQASWATVAHCFQNSSYWSNTTGLRDQFYCHFNFAFFKSQFNLEPSRPNVGYDATVRSSCNP